MEQKRFWGRITAMCAAVAMTICGAWYASARAAKSAVRTAGSPAERKVIILDAGHGASG